RPPRSTSSTGSDHAMDNDTDNSDDDLDNLDLAELYREARDELIAWENQLRASFDRAVDWAHTLLPPPPPKLEDLLSSFDLEDNYQQRQTIIHWNSAEEREAAHDSAVEAKEKVDEARDALGAPQDLLDRAEAAALDVASAALDELATATET